MSQDWITARTRQDANELTESLLHELQRVGDSPAEVLEILGLRAEDIRVALDTEWLSEDDKRNLEVLLLTAPQFDLDAEVEEFATAGVDSNPTSSGGSSIVFHPAFVSEVNVTDHGSATRQIYRQTGVHHLGNRGLPKVHNIRIEGRNESEKIEIRLLDPSHRIANITLEVYGEGKDPFIRNEPPIEKSFTFRGGAVTCPPMCEGE